MTNHRGWYPIYLREMLLFRRKLFKLGYLLCAMVVPVIYLVAFGLGLGRIVQTGHGTYLDFLIPGLVAMSCMTNSYSWVANALNLNRLYTKNFQLFVQAPIAPSSIMVGEVLAGVTKGLFASILIMIVGFIVSRRINITLPYVAALLVSSCLFASLGVITGMVTKSHEDTATYANFFILPMGFFSGTFFPVDRMPAAIKCIIYIMPLTYTNILIRKALVDREALLSLSALLLYAAVFFLYGSRVISRYSE
jgi:Nod factor-specific ABC transporter NodJ protein